MPRVSGNSYFDKQRNRTVRRPRTAPAGEPWYYDTKEGRAYRKENDYLNRKYRAEQGRTRSQVRRRNQRLRERGYTPRAPQGRRIRTQLQYQVSDGLRDDVISFIRRFPNSGGVVQLFAAGETGTNFTGGSVGVGPNVLAANPKEQEVPGEWFTLRRVARLSDAIPLILDADPSGEEYFWRVLREV